MELENQSLNCKNATIYQLKQAWYNNQPISGVTTLLDHYDPHPDELGSNYLVQHTVEGRVLFPGIEDATLAMISGTDLRTNGYLGNDGFFKALQRGCLLFGTGGGLFDEHRDREKRISCITLVVRKLNLFADKYNRKIYGPLVTYIETEDNNSDDMLKLFNEGIKERCKANGTNPHDYRLPKEKTEAMLALKMGSFARNLKEDFEAAGDDMDEKLDLMRDAYKFFLRRINSVKQFIDLEESYNKSQVTILPLSITIPSEPASFILLETQNDKPKAAKAIQKRWSSNPKQKIGVLFLHKSNGQFVLMPNSYLNKSIMKEVVGVLRQMVAHKRNQGEIKFKDLKLPEIIDEVPEIHFAEVTGIISNGSKTDPNVPGLIGTYLSVQDVMDAVEIGLELNYFPQRFKNGCNAGMCEKGRCPFYGFGLQRCFDIRNTNNPMTQGLKEFREKQVA